MKTVFFDVDTQLDFISPAGALYVPGAEEIVGSLEDLTRFADKNRVQIISTVDAHTENDPEFQIWKPHCVAGTQGQQKLSETLLGAPLVVDSRPGSLEAVSSQVASARQIVVEKRQLDVFSNGNLHSLLELINAERYVVYGLVTEYCVRSAAFGLLERKARVELVVDAVKSLGADDERVTLERFQAQGGRLVTVGDVLQQT
ncbi:MAG: cysteine hydrolase [Acidobacteriota bacterium]|nr:cysteine hydrolase [Acidobacteriota bacterium]